jgi:hypothetical protein
MDTPALRPDGTFKDPSEMEWEYSPGRPMPPPHPQPSPSLRPATIRFVTPITAANPTQKRPRPSEYRAPKEAGRAGSSQKKKPAAVKAAVTTKPIDRVMSLASVATREASDDEDTPKLKKRKKGDAIADILTVYRALDLDIDGSTGYECTICM